MHPLLSSQVTKLFKPRLSEQSLDDPFCKVYPHLYKTTPPYLGETFSKTGKLTNFFTDFLGYFYFIFYLGNFYTGLGQVDVSKT